MKASQSQAQVGFLLLGVDIRDGVQSQVDFDRSGGDA